jgi:hypothetical protein
MSQGVTEVGCLAHARRKFFDLHASNKSQIAHSALEQIARVYDIEREIKELDPDERRRVRQEKSKPLLDALHQWMILNRQKVPDGAATAKALDYSLRRWGALTRFVSDGQLPVDNNHIENQIRPIAIGRNNANDSLMRTHRLSPREQRGISRLSALRVKSGLHIRVGISYGGNPTSGDIHGCLRVLSSGAGGLASRQRSRIVHSCLRPSSC